jgi:hypothetical protein
MPAPFSTGYASLHRNCQKLLCALIVLNIMDMQRKPVGDSPYGCDNGLRPVVTVDLPLPYEGIVNALRACYHSARSDLPPEMLDLLAELDRS